MSVSDARGVQLSPDEYQALGSDDALMLARAVARDDRLTEGERMRLVWAALDAGRFGMPGDGR